MSVSALLAFMRGRRQPQPQLLFVALLAVFVGGLLVGPAAAACTTSGTNFNCFGQLPALTAIPTGIPTTTTSLNLYSNQISSIPNGSFSSLGSLWCLEA
eukprot:m.4929 g.4929  ORF g.4929 m.4929 type:complete len:99 (-) comp4415_c0_seq1:4-300(-)